MSKKQDSSNLKNRTCKNEESDIIKKHESRTVRKTVSVVGCLQRLLGRKKHKLIIISSAGLPEDGNSISDFNLNKSHSHFISVHSGSDRRSCSSLAQCIYCNVYCSSYLVFNNVCAQWYPSAPLVKLHCLTYFTCWMLIKTKIGAKNTLFYKCVSVCDIAINLCHIYKKGLRNINYLEYKCLIVFVDFYFFCVSLDYFKFKYLFKYFKYTIFKYFVILLPS